MAASTRRAAAAGDERVVVAVDVGNSKTDVALVTTAGEVLATLTGPTASDQAVGPRQAMATLATLVADARGLAARLAPGIGAMAPSLLVHCAAGVDLPADARRIRKAIAGLGLADEVLVFNDTEAAFRAGARRPYGVVVICGAGVNAAGFGPGGRAARFPSLGAVSGDWGGGYDLGLGALRAAIRGRDGRGPRTMLERSVPAYFGRGRPLAVTTAIYRRRLDVTRLRELAPLVFDAATAGDEPARVMVDRLADEVVAMAAVMLRRLRLVREPVDVVLAGGVFGAGDPAFHDRIRCGVAAIAPAAAVIRLEAPPVLGAALIGLDRLGATAGAKDRLRAGFERSASATEPGGHSGHG